MRIRRLELTGFKSFCERTVFQFAPGMSCIVGPNGCGKSNVIDAIRWILGEQNARRLRGEGMEDVIFGGSSSSAATGFAEAILVLDNSDGDLGEQFERFSEVEVGRRLYRDGDSQYLLNGSRCRLKDIAELFMDTGVGARASSVIEQGRVVRLISSRPEDRRALIEEAAGIVGYKARRRTANNRLESTEQNLLRVGDVAAELKRQMNALRRQASKANRFRRLQAFRKESEVLLSLAETRERTDAFRECNDQLADLESQRDVLRQQEAARQVRLDAQQDGQRAARDAVDEIKSRLAHRRADLQSREREREFSTREIERLDTRLGALSGEAADTAERSLALEQSEKDMLAEVEERQTELKLRSEQQVERDTEMGRLDNALAEMNAQVTDRRCRAEDQLGSITRLHSEVAGVEQRLRDQRARADILGREHAEASVVLADGQARLAGVEEALAEADAEITARRAHLADLDGELEGRKGGWAAMSTTLDELEALVREREARRISLQEILDQREGFDAGVREVMRLRERGEGDYRVLGTVADVVEVSPQYEQAVEAALGEALQYILVQTQDDCVIAITDLEERGAGRTSFVPVDDLRALSSGEPPRGRGVVADAREVVRAAEPFGDVLDMLLDDVTVVEDLRAAVRLWKRGRSTRRLVTLDGDTVMPSGIVSGGARVEGGVLGQKRELRRLEGELADLGAQTSEGRVALKRISTAMDQLTERREATRGELHELDVRRAGVLSELQAVRREVGAAGRRLLSLEEERDVLAPATAAIEEEQRKVQAAVEQAEGERDVLRQQIAAFDSRALELRTQRDARRSEAFEARLEATAARERLESVRQRLAQLEANRADVRGKLEQERAERTRVEQLIEDHRRRVLSRATDCEQIARAIEGEGTDLERAIQHQERVEAERRTLESEVRELRERSGKLDARIQDVSSQVAVLNAEITHLANGLRADHGLDLKRLFGQLESDGSVEVVLRGTLPRPLDDEPVSEADAAGDAGTGAPDDDGAEADGIRIEFGWEQLLEVEGLQQRAEQLHKTRVDLDRIGEINMGAPEAYEEVRVEHGKLKAQMEDLEASIARIRRGISKLNRESRERFGKAFAEVNRHFQELYPRLTGGGKAYLALTDPEDLLETGVEANVQPPGKKLKAMGLLSGGEKAMAAISLLFAVFLHRPSPFCLLDEVDAELDEANVRRVCQLLTEMSGRTQFIVITHKRLTMETADTLFGVTMEQPGVSKLVTVKLEDVA